MTVHKISKTPEIVSEEYLMWGRWIYDTLA